MTTVLFRSRLALVLVPFVSIAGCGGETAPLTPVKGKVSYHGSPLHTGMIVFSPDEAHGNSGPLARAEIQADGTYVLQTGEQPGARPGFYRVTVVAVERTPTGQGYDVLRPLLPDKYRDPQLSNLACEVKPGKENGFNFNLD